MDQWEYTYYKHLGKYNEIPFIYLPWNCVSNNIIRSIANYSILLYHVIYRCLFIYHLRTTMYFESLNMAEKNLGKKTHNQFYTIKIIYREKFLCVFYVCVFRFWNQCQISL